MEKLYTSKKIFKISGGRMHIPHPTLLVISCRNHQKSLAYFSHLALLIFFIFTKKQSQRGRGVMAQCSSLNTLLSLPLGGYAYKGHYG